MDVTYRQFLNIVVKHAYFKKGKSTIFNLVPFHQSARQMGNYSILLNSSENSFSLFTGLRSDETFDIATKFSGIDDLYFQLVVNDLYFFNYTELEVVPEGALFLLSNKDKQSASTSLHNDEFVSESEILQIRPPQSNYVIPEGDVKLVVTNSEGEVVKMSEHSNTHQINILLDLRSEESGVFELWLNNEKKERFFLTGQSFDPGCIGIVQLNMATLMNNYADGMLYHINFDSLITYWRYKIVLPSDRQLIEVKIVGMGAEIYTNSGEEDFMGDQKAIVFTSDQPMVLRQEHDSSPTLHFTFSSEHADSESMTLNLPIPGPETISMNTNEQNEQSFYSTSIIYV